MYIHVIYIYAYMALSNERLLRTRVNLATNYLVLKLIGLTVVQIPPAALGVAKAAQTSPRPSRGSSLARKRAWYERRGYMKW